MTLLLQKQKFLHDPESGIHGDCYRTCVASILGTIQDDVPHVYAHPQQRSDAGGTDEMRAYLQQFGLCLFDMKLDARIDLAGLIVGVTDKDGPPAIITGKSPRGDRNHCIIADNGVVAMDPFTGKPGDLSSLDGPGLGTDGEPGWWIEIIAFRQQSQIVI